MLNKNSFLKSFKDGLKPTDKITISEWSNKYRYLTAGSSASTGRYSTEKTPYLVEIMDCFLDDSGVETVAFMKSTQVGASEAMNNIIGYIIDYNPASTMVLTSTVDAAKKYSKTRIDPMIDSCKSIKDKMITNNVQDKSFIGGNLFFFGANSPSALRSNPVKNGLFDEVDSYPLDLGDEGDPISIARKRGNTFPLRKFFYISTPTISGISKIEEVFEQGDQRHYNVPCPHCGGMLVLNFYNLKFKTRENNDRECDPDSVYYQCDFCQSEIKEYHKTRMLSNGKWVPTKTNVKSKVRSYHINALYSPIGWLSWPEIIDEHLLAKVDPFKMKTFINTNLGLPYKDKTTQPDYKKLYNRREEYKFREANKKIVYVCAGADTQDDRLAYCILGFGEDNEIWVLAYNEVLGDPSKKDVWKQFKREIERPIRHETGVELEVKDCFIDSAGHNTKHVYDFCRRNERFHPIVGRGDSGGGYVKNGATIDKDEYGNKYSNALQLYIINTILTKKTVYSYLQNKEEGAGYVHFSKDLNVQFFEMITSEYMIIEEDKKGNRKEKFIKPSGVRNEALDCFSYAYALAEMRGISNVYGREYEDVYKKNIISKLEDLKLKEVMNHKNEENNKKTIDEIEEEKKNEYINKMNQRRKNKESKKSFFSV